MSSKPINEENLLNFVNNEIDKFMEDLYNDIQPDYPEDLLELAREIIRCNPKSKLIKELTGETNMTKVTKEQFANHVNILAKDGSDILPTITAEKCDLLHMVMGVSGEVGELTDAVKKHVFYNQPLDVENAREELGDILFYVQGVMNNLRFDMDEILQENIDKLSKRYPDGYSDASAKARLDKEDGE